MLGAQGSSKMDLGFRVYLKDNFSGPAREMKNTLDGLKSEYGMYRSNLSAARNAALAIGAGALMISRGLYEAAMEGAEFLHTMQGVLAISEATTIEFEKLTSLAVSLGRETIFTPDQVASGMRFMAMAGQTAAQIQATAKDATYLAAATMTPLGGKLGSADILTNALKAFGLQVESSTDMSDMLTYATTSANVSLVDLGNSIRYVASTSKNLNIPIQDTIGMIMSLGNAGIQSSMAGTALENMFRYLAMSISDFSTKRQKSAWASIGLGKEDIMTASGQFKPMIEVLGLIKSEIDQLGAVDRQNILKEIFGVRGQRAAGTILRNLDEAGGFMQQLAGAGIKGITEEKSALMMETLHGASLRLTSAIDGLKAAWAKMMGNIVLKSLLNGLATMVGWFTSFIKLPIVSHLAVFTAGVITLIGVMFSLRAVMFTIALMADRIKVSFAGMNAAATLAMGSMGGRSALNAGYSVSTYKSGPQKGKQYFKGPTGMVVSSKNAMKSFKWAKWLKWLPRIGGFLGRGLAILAGPWGMAIMAAVTLLPMLISGIKGLIGATKDNTKALTKTSDYDPKWIELFALMKGQTINATWENINKNMAKLLANGTYTLAEIKELLKTDKGMYEVIRMGYQEGVLALVPITYPESGQPNSKIDKK